MTEPLFNYKDFENKKYGPCRLIEFQIPGGITTPEEFAGAVRDEGERLYPPGKGVIISGRGPVWGYAMIVHAAHPARWIATVDPRLGAVVVQSHVPEMRAGDVIPLSEIDGEIRIS